MDEYQSRIFEMYFRANEHSKGNGLGLYIARKAGQKSLVVVFFSGVNMVLAAYFTLELPNKGE